MGKNFAVEEGSEGEVPPVEMIENEGSVKLFGIAEQRGGLLWREEYFLYWCPLRSPTGRRAFQRGPSLFGLL